MILTVVVFFLVLGVLVLVHELGHFVVARKSGVKVEEFGFGLPPRMIGFYKDDVGKWRTVGLKTKDVTSMIWSLNWIPLGGFVKIKGENGENSEQADSFGHQSVFKRILIISAGVFMNIVLAAVLLSIGLSIGSPQVIDESNLSKFAQTKDIKVRIMEVLPDSPAERAGLELADTILAIDGHEIVEIEELQNFLDQKVGATISLTVERKDEVLTKELTPEFLSEIDRGGMGVALVRTGFVSYPWYLSWWYGIIETFKMIWAIIAGFYLIIKNLIINKQMIGEVYGPVGIAGLVGDAARLGFLYLMQFTAVLSVIIAVINFLPFPALDGGRILFLIIEGVRGKPANQKFEALMHNLGFALLMILVLVVTFRDVVRISSGFFG